MNTSIEIDRDDSTMSSLSLSLLVDFHVRWNSICHCCYTFIDISLIHLPRNNTHACVRWVFFLIPGMWMSLFDDIECGTYFLINRSFSCEWRLKSLHRWTNRITHRYKSPKARRRKRMTCKRNWDRTLRRGNATNSSVKWTISRFALNVFSSKFTIPIGFNGNRWVLFSVVFWIFFLITFHLNNSHHQHKFNCTIIECIQFQWNSWCALLANMISFC